MADLFGSLTMAARALQAQSTGLDVVGQNIANANTEGYARRQVTFQSVAPANNWSAGGGVDISSIHAVRDEMLERRLRSERPGVARESALADQLSVVQASIGKSGTSIDGNLDAFFNSWSTLSLDPTSLTSREAVLAQAKSLATSINDMSAQFQNAREQADTAVQSTVAEVNDLVNRIASLNDSIARAGGTGTVAAGLQDEQNQALKSLSELVDIGVTPNKTGGMDVSFANGRPLVVGENAYAVSLGKNAEGMATVLTGGTDVTSEITGGKVAGLVQARDVVIKGYIGKLDTIAYTLAGTVNAQHRLGYTLDGAPGGDVFQPIATVAGAAAALKMDTALAANPRLLAAAGSTSAGDNGNARTMADLRYSKVFSGGTGTFNDAWADLTYTVGQDSATATSDVKGRQEVLTQIESLRDAVSGVSLDEEAMMMMKFQRAYEANARFFATIDSAISTLINMVRN